MIIQHASTSIKIEPDLANLQLVVNMALFSRLILPPDFPTIIDRQGRNNAEQVEHGRSHRS